MNKEELLYNEIYERTKDFGRTQFVREIMRLQRENKELQQKINQLETNRDEAIDFIKKTQFDCGEFNCCGFGIWKDGRNELLEILERGKE